MSQLVAFEGPDGSGKSSFMIAINDRMNKRGLTTISGRQPGGTPAGEAIRSLLVDPSLEMDPLTQVHLFTASRENFLEQCARPALLEGKTVLCDRFDLSTIFYQTAMMKQDLVERYGITTDTAKQVLTFHKKANEIIRGGAEDISLRYLVMDADDEVLDGRRPHNPSDRFEAMDASFQKDMRGFYRQYAGANRFNRNVRVVNTNHPIGGSELDAIIDWIIDEEVACPTKITA